MSPAGEKRDLVVLVPAADEKSVFQELLKRSDTLGIRPISYEIVRHLNRDSGVFGDSHNFLRPQLGRFRHALAICDRHGCGRDTRRREEIETQIRQNLAANGWGDSGEAVVIDPELEIWLWADFQRSERVLGWQGQESGLQVWLQDRRLLERGEHKPGLPKEAWLRALRIVNKQKSPALFQNLAATLPLDRCTDPAFLKLRGILRRWFGPDSACSA